MSTLTEHMSHTDGCEGRKKVLCAPKGGGINFWMLSIVQNFLPFVVGLLLLINCYV